MGRVLLNGLQIAEDGAGISIYAKKLADSYCSNYEDVDVLVRDSYISDFESSNFIKYHKPIKSSVDRIITEQIFCSNLLKKYDIVHYPDYAIPVICPVPCISTVHDMAFFSIEDAYTKKQAFAKKILTSCMVKNAARIICISDFTAGELLKYFPGVDQEKVKVVYNGVRIIKNRILEDFKAMTKKYRITKPYIFYSGTLAPHKNIVRLIQAFNLIKQQGLDFQLVIAGRKGWKYDDIFKETERLDLKTEVIFTGYIPENEKESFYSNCEFVAFVSLYEGFGLPPLEALVRDKPVLVSNVAAIPEVIGDAGVYCNPYDVYDIAKGMAKLITQKNMGDYLVEKGKKRIKLFSWEKTSAKTHEVYEELIRKTYYQNSVKAI